MMTAEQLRASILQLAMQGKLVEQRPEEGTGKQLYAEIQAEKHKLIESGKIKKQKALPKITESEIPFEIPGSWEWVRLTDICTKVVDGDHNPPKGINGISDYIMASSKNINDDQLVDLDQVRYLDEKTFFKENERTDATSGDIFFTSVGSLGRSCVYEGGLNICFQRSVSVITTLAFNYYIKCCFDSSYFQSKVRRESTGTAQKGFYLSQLASSVVPLPPLEEQKRIVAKIEELMPFVEQYAAASNKLNELNTSFPDMMKKSILQEAVKGKLVPQDSNDEPASELLKRIAEEKQRLIKEGKIKKQKALPEITEDEIPFDIPDSWEWARWGNISESIQYGYNAPAKQIGRIKMVRISDIQDNTVLWENVPYCDITEESIQEYLLEKDDILFARTGGTVGKSFLVKQVNEEAIFAGYLIRTRYSKNLCPEYLKLFMESDLYWRQLRDGTIATAQPNCNGKTLSLMMIPIPPLEEQKRITAKIEKLLGFINDLCN